MSVSPPRPVNQKPAIIVPLRTMVKTVLGMELKVEFFGGFLEWEMEHSSFLEGQQNSDCIFPKSSPAPVCERIGM